jgi:heparosan-N-sulfate-glucuronate 5-epimerase
MAGATIKVVAVMEDQHVAEASLVPDENGVVMCDYGGSLGVVYNPKVAAQAGLKYYDQFLSTGDPQVKKHFFNTTDWLMAHATDRGNYSVWEYSFAWRSYGGVCPPYASALAQAEGVNVLTRAHNMTGDDRYVVEAKKAFGAFMVDYEDGGVASDEGRDSLFLQLLAKPGFQKTYVLNGHSN